MVSYGEFIPMFRTDHLIFIGGLAVMAVLLFRYKDKVKEKRKTITKIILFTSLIQQILLYSSYFFLKEFDLSESLPLHISRINTIIGIFYLLTKKEILFTFLCYFGLSAWASFLYPSRVYGITHPLGISFFINHLITLLLPFYAMIAQGARLRKGDKNTVFKWFLVYLVFVYFFNPLVDGNYFYLKHKPFLKDVSDVIYIPFVILLTYALFSLGEALYMKVQVSLPHENKH